MKQSCISSVLRTLCSTVLLALLGHDAVATPSDMTLAIQKQGSFFIGGDVVNRGPGDDVTVHQMYVQFQVPIRTTGVPVIMTHGCCSSSKTWETTPDGRMGWAEYFLRKGHPVYLTDQVGQARSGFNHLVKMSEDYLRLSHQSTWVAFRFGPLLNEPFPDQQFPTEAVDEFFKEIIPDLTSSLPVPSPTLEHLAELARKLDGAVLMGHSQSGSFPLEAGLRNPSSVRGMIVLEGACNRTSGVTDGQVDFVVRPQKEIEALAKIPLLVMFGDHLEGNSRITIQPSGLRGDYWQGLFDDCKGFVQRVRAAGGDATMLYLPAMKIFGNSHMLMQDRNNLELADIILKWLYKSTLRK